MSGEEDAVQDEREAKSNGKDGTIPKMELVRQIHVSKKCVGIKRLSSESGDQNPNRKTTAGDEVVLRLALDKEDGEETDEARDAGKDSDGDTISDGGRGILGRAGDQANLFLRASSRVFGADTDGKEKRQ
mmetsp:Transcript_18679/g.44274  ORF Transcript_18679/g.44274 Transcript_18679/m.44274 type:complete len:130 (-) Transcript_18679:139-528(-)